MMNPDWLETAAERGARVPELLGSMFAWYRDLEDLSVQALAEQLGCTEATLHWMSLCRRPRSEAFAADVLRIAERFGVDPSGIFQVLRHIEVTEALITQSNSPVEPSARALQLAARDQEKKP